MAQGDVDQHQSFNLARMNGEDGIPKSFKKREGRPRGPRTGPGGVTMDFPLRIVVPSEMVGAIIGRQGGTIHQITQETRARVDIDRKNDMNAVEKTIFIYGQPENCTEACKRILYVIKQEAANTKKSEPPLKILAHNNLIGRLIGKGGNTIKQIMQDSNTRVNVSSVSDVNYNCERVITVRGESIENGIQAEKQISAKLRESYEADLRDFAPQGNIFPQLNPMAMYGQNNFGVPPYGYNPMRMAAPMYNVPPNYSVARNQEETAYLYVHKNSVGAIIGTKGNYIRNIIRYSGATIKIAPLCPENGDQTERKVTIVGNAEAQWKAQYLIQEKIRESGFVPNNDEVNLKVEIVVPSPLIGRIIGKKGQNIKELQRVSGAFVKIPKLEDGDTKETTAIRIVGSFYGVQSVQRRIHSILQSSSPQNGHGSKSVSPTNEKHQQHQ